MPAPFLLPFALRAKGPGDEGRYLMKKGAACCAPTSDVIIFVGASHASPVDLFKTYPCREGAGG